MNKLFFFSLYLLLTGNICAQKHDNVWIYSRKTALPSNKITKIIFEPDSVQFEITSFKGAMIAKSGNSISNIDGDLMFYSDGLRILNRVGEIMKNGDSLNAPIDNYWKSREPIGYPAESYVLPLRTDTSKYYLIHFKIIADPSPKYAELRYSLIDMNGDNGMGGVVSKDSVLIKTTSLERSSAVRHGNGRDWWVVTPDNDAKVFYRNLLTPQGFEDPIEQYVPEHPVDPGLAANDLSKFTPDGSKFIHYHPQQNIDIYDFDRCTGEASYNTQIIIPMGTSIWPGSDFEVSPNSRYLYVVGVDFTRIIQYDLLSTDIAASGDTVAYYDGYVHWGGGVAAFGYMQRGPDGKIYIASCSCDLMHVINNPDLPGAACGFVQRAIQLPTWNYGTVPYMPNYRLYDAPSSPCDSLGIDGPVATAEWPGWLLEKGLLYPNPTSDVSTLYLKNWQGAGRMEVSDMEGKIVFQQSVTRDRTSFPVSGWRPGLYVVKVWKDGRVVMVEKLMVSP